MNRREFILSSFDESKSASGNCKETIVEDLLIFINLFEKTFQDGNKVLIFGNGGCAGVAQQLTGAFIGRFKSGKPARPVISLSSDAALMTTLSNDYGFENIYKKQVEAYANRGDLVIGLSTSGNSVNVIKGMETAKEKGAYTVGITGEGGGKLKEIADFMLRIPSKQPTQIENSMAEISSILCKVLD